ncbi:MAG: hypothetical protein K9H16_02780 [Bacteroidales bacterium]|nr:hypothetical protein [Bacteroidales bacterium]
MKRFFSVLSLVIFMVSGISVMAAKKKAFTGQITFKISIEADNIPEQAKAMLPKTMIMYVGSDKTKSELFTQMGNQSSIEDLVAKSKIGLLDMMGQKYALHESYDDVLKEKEALPGLELEFTDETKEIAGFVCKKVVAKKKDDGSVFSTAWVAEELEVHENINFSNTIFDGVKGLMLQFDIEAGNGMFLTFTAFEIEQKKIKDSVFEVPEGYKATTMEELESTFGQ